jgi:hypothetical protein
VDATWKIGRLVLYSRLVFRAIGAVIWDDTARSNLALDE